MIVIPFDKVIAGLTAEQFVEEVLLRRLAFAPSSQAMTSISAQARRARRRS